MLSASDSTTRPEAEHVLDDGLESISVDNAPATHRNLVLELPSYLVRVRVEHRTGQSVVFAHHRRIVRFCSPVDIVSNM